MLELVNVMKNKHKQHKTKQKQGSLYDSYIPCHNKKAAKAIFFLFSETISEFVKGNQKNCACCGNGDNLYKAI